MQRHHKKALLTQPDTAIFPAREHAHPFAFVLEALPVHTLLLDGAGCVLIQNRRWRELWPDWQDCPLGKVGSGQPYMDVWLRDSVASSAAVDRVHSALHRLMTRESLRETLLVECYGKHLSHWIEWFADRPEEGNGEIVVSHSRGGGPTLDQLNHLQRVASAGELAGSLAHEVNQPLMAIQANAAAAVKLLSVGTEDIAEARAALNDIEDDCRRASAIVDRIRRFLKKSEVRRERIELNDLTRDTLRLLHSELIRQGVRVAVDLVHSPLVFEGDHVQVQQALLNLLRNGIQAMSHLQLDHRKLWVSTTCCGQRIAVVVCDSGDGIPEHVLPRTFEPFFTTNAGGMGLGLTIARSIVEAAGGEVRARNHESGRGAVFEILLPRASGS